MPKNKNLGHNSKKDFLKNPVEHIDITSFDSRKIISSMEKMSFVSRETANAANIYNEMLKDKDCTIFLTLAGSTSAAGCMNIYKDLVKYNMVDAIVATGASIIDMDFFEALGFKHYQGSQFQDDTELRKNYIDRIYDTYIDENQLQMVLKEDSHLVSKTDGDLLFDDEGNETEYLTKRKSALGHYFESSHVTKAFIKQLSDKSLLSQQNLSLELNGEKIAINGVYLVDEKALNSLADEDFLELRKKGYLGPIYNHLSSLHQLSRLAQLKSEK